MRAGGADSPGAARAAQLLAEGRAKIDLPALAGEGAVLMADTRLHNTFTCQPQQRNMHGRVFGGFLMRWAAGRPSWLRNSCRPLLCAYNHPVSWIHIHSACPNQPITPARALNHTMHSLQTGWQYWTACCAFDNTHCQSRRAFELAFATSYLFAGCRPTFVRVGEITFQRPVEVGDLLRLQSTVQHTSQSGGQGLVSVLPLAWRITKLFSAHQGPCFSVRSQTIIDFEAEWSAGAQEERVLCLAHELSTVCCLYSGKG